jgi:acetyltransferase-like isoleucine patch superfamily enzyme
MNLEDLAYSVYADVCMIFGGFVDFIYKVLYGINYPKSHLYLRMPPSAFKSLCLGEYSVSNSIIEVQNVRDNNFSLYIGKYTHIGRNLQILPSGVHTPEMVSNNISPHPNPAAKSVWIGHDVWVGNDVKIIGNKVIASGAVIGAGAIVTKDVKPYEIVAGTPARHKRYRFGESIIKDLLVIKWWDWDEETIKSRQSKFCNPALFCKEYSARTAGRPHVRSRR